MRMKRLLFLVVCGACAVSAAGGASARQAVSFGDIRHAGLNRSSAPAGTTTSANWAGYAATHRRPFTSVTGRWVQPVAACDEAAQTFSAFWVGLGGFSRSSFGVEQVGTAANCSGGRPSYQAWYELFPAPPVYLRLRVQPGDMLSATVSVKGKTVVIRLKNVTSGKLFRTRLRTSRPDVGSAEWVAEAPSDCDYVGNCATLPLTNFGTVAFSHASATVKGHKGRISDPVWGATSIELHGDLNDPDTLQVGANAIPGALGPDGGSFAVTWQQVPPPGA